MTELETIAALRRGGPYRNDRFTSQDEPGGPRRAICVLANAVLLRRPLRFGEWAVGGRDMGGMVVPAARLLEIHPEQAREISEISDRDSGESIDALARAWGLE